MAKQSTVDKDSMQFKNDSKGKNKPKCMDSYQIHVDFVEFKHLANK